MQETRCTKHTTPSSRDAHELPAVHEETSTSGKRIHANDASRVRGPHGAMAHRLLGAERPQRLNP
jgi:hypothetical protein